jgi:hypothetical protein
MNTNRYHHLSWLHGIGLFEAMQPAQILGKVNHKEPAPRSKRALKAPVLI